MSDVSSIPVVGNARTPRMANLDAGHDKSRTAMNSNSETKKQQQTTTPTTLNGSSNKKSKSDPPATAPSNDSATKRTPRRSTSSRQQRRNSTSSTTSSQSRSHHRASALRPPTTPLKTHNTNSSASVASCPSLSATGLMETANPAAVVVNTTATSAAAAPVAATKTKSAPQTVTSSPSLPRRSNSVSSVRPRRLDHDDKSSWTYHEREVFQLQTSTSATAADTAKPLTDCLDASLQVLRTSMQQAQQAVSLQQLECGTAEATAENGNVVVATGMDEDDYNDEETRQTLDGDDDGEGKEDDDGDGTNVGGGNNKDPAAASTSSWWMSIVQRIQDGHDAERYKWKDDLRVAKIQGKHLKSELRESIEQRIQWLEDRLAWEDQMQQQSRGGDGGHGADTIQSTSSGTTMVTASTFGNYTNYTADDKNSLHRSIAGAAANGVEVSFDTAQAIQRLGELEQRVQDFEFEKEQWERALAHAEIELQKDKKLSGAMQEQLQRLAQEVDSYSDNSHKHCKEKQKVQKQLLQLLEQQLTTERYEWQQEKELLDHTIQQLTLDKAQGSIDLRNSAGKLQRLAREEKKLRSERETWLYDKSLLEVTIQQLSMDKSAYKASAETLRRQLAAAEQRLGEDNNIDNASQGPPAVETVYSELDESLDRAVAERDLYKQEAESLRKTLDLERSRWLEAEAVADDTVNEIRSEFEAIVDELKVQLQKKSSTTSTQTPSNESGCTAESTTQTENEQHMKRVRDEYTAVIEDLEARLDSQGEQAESQQLEGFIVKNKELSNKLRALERQHADDRGEWKLRLEAALADCRKLRETKESLEEEIRDMKEANTPAADEVSMSEQLRAALADSERLQLELASLRQNYEAEVQSILDQAEARPSPSSKGEWKLQLEAALAETRRVRRLKEDLETEIRELKESFEHEKGAWLESGNANIEDLRSELSAIKETVNECNKENVALKAEIGVLHEVEQKFRHQNDLLSDLKEKYDRETQEWSAQLDESRLHEEVEMEELKMKYNKEVKDLQKTIRTEQETIQELQKQHMKEIKLVKSKGQAFEEKVNQLSKELQVVNSQHSQAKAKWESELHRIAAEKEGRIRELEMTISHTKQQDTTSDRLLGTVSELVGGLHADMDAVKRSVEAVASKKIDGQSVDDLKSSMDEIQNSLHDTIAELTLEADSIMEIKALLETFTAKASPTLDSSRFAATQECLVGEVKAIRTEINGLVKTIAASGPKDEMYQDAVAELQRKVLQVSQLQAELEVARIELERKSTLLIDAEAEILALNDQADAYSDELMRVQSVNASSEKNLRLAERKVHALMNAPNMPHGLDDFDECGNTKSYDDSTPMLEEALALAQGLQELVQGRDSDQNVLEMLQSMSDLMDHHERGDDSSSEASSQQGSEVEISGHLNEGSKRRPYSPQRRQQVAHRDSSPGNQEREEPPPNPVETPLQPPRRHDGTVPLQLVVEQLYGRCQLLERERTEMMEVTLNLLESARKSNAAEMDAALATVRRRTMEDVIRARQQTIMDQERLYQRLCSNESGGASIAADQGKPLERSRPIVPAE